MNYNKRFSAKLKACYALVRLKDDTHDFILVASELNEPCYAFDLNDQFRQIVVWPDIGGTMTLVQIPGSLDFLATQKFYPGFNAASCRIVRGRFNGVDWNVEPIQDMPYLHRFTLLQKEGHLYFVGCTIAKTKQTISDWSDPGEIIVGRYDEEIGELCELRTLDQKITMNHGFCFDEKEQVIYISGKEGVFVLRQGDSEEWRLKQLFDQETSDVYNTDINEDGVAEFISIQGFHGPQLTVYNESFTKVVYQHQELTPFGHALWGGVLYQKHYFIFGNREEQQNLFILGMSDGEMYEEIIDQQVGSSNILVLEKEGRYYLASANNSVDEFALYEITDGGNGR